MHTYKHIYVCVYVYVFFLSYFLFSAFFLDKSSGTCKPKSKFLKAHNLTGMISGLCFMQSDAIILGVTEP